MPTPLVSIIVNNFNYARFLPTSVGSALAQTHPAVEVIAVDDASTDGSRDVLARYGERIRTVLQPENGGQAAAFNAGFAASRGDIVMFLDADDWLYPEAASRVAAAWTSGLSKLHFRLDLVDAEARHIDVFPPPEVRLDRGDVVPLLLSIGRYETVVTSGNAFGRAALERVMPIPVESFRISADGYLVSVVPFHGPVAVLDDRLGAYRQHGGNLYSNSSVTGASGVDAELAERMRRWIAHDAEKLKAIVAEAAATGRSLTGSPSLRDPAHVEARLASLRLEPRRHPYPGDHRLALAVRGVLASRRSRLPPARRLVMAAWFVAVGLLPAHAAAAAVRWRFLPGARSPQVDRTLKWVRRLLR